MSAEPAEESAFAAVIGRLGIAGGALDRFNRLMQRDFARAEVAVERFLGGVVLTVPLQDIGTVRQHAPAFFTVGAQGIEDRYRQLQRSDLFHGFTGI